MCCFVPTWQLTDTTRRQAKVKEKPQMPYCRNVHSFSFARCSNIWNGKLSWDSLLSYPQYCVVEAAWRQVKPFYTVTCCEQSESCNSNGKSVSKRASVMASMFYMEAMFCDNCANTVTLNLWNTMGMRNTAGLSSFCACTFWSCYPGGNSATPLNLKNIYCEQNFFFVLSMLICFIGVMKMLDAYNKVTCITKHYHGPTRFILHAFHYTSFDKLHGALWVPPHGFHLFI